MMKKRIILASAISLILPFSFWFKPQAPSPPFSGDSNTIPSPGGGTNQTSQVQVTATQRRRMTARDLVEYGRSVDIRPIEFYGKVIDQDSNPIPNVEIEYTVYPTPTGPDPGIGKLMSDDQGLFSVRNHMGARIAFALRKSGYRPAEPHSGASYSLFSPDDERYTPNSTDPQILRMWREKGAEELFEVNQEYECDLPECSVRIDLLKAQLVEAGGDLQIIISRGPGSRDKGELFDWRCVILPIDGGVQIVDDRSAVSTTFEAPITGYTNRLEFINPKNDVKWQSMKSVYLFLMSRSGRIYARFGLNISVNVESKARIWIPTPILSHNVVCDFRRPV
jgi:hypothetical protein